MDHALSLDALVPGDTSPEAFADAVRRAPSNVEANYGYGYTLLKLGRTQEAIGPLCKARNTTQADILQDVNGLLASRQLACP